MSFTYQSESHSGDCNRGHPSHPSYNPHGLYSPWGPKESDTTYRLSLSLEQSNLNLFIQFAVNRIEAEAVQ